MTSTPRAFSASYTRTERGWKVTVERPTLSVRARTLESARIAAVEAIAGHFGVAPSLVMLDEDVVLDPLVQEAVQGALDARDAAIAAQEAHARRQERAAVVMAGAGLSMRDSAYLLGLSHSRIQQLLGTVQHSPGDST